jgi:hypothetical protein
MIGFIGTSLQLQSIITAHTFNSWMIVCLTNDAWRILRCYWISDWSPCKLFVVTKTCLLKTLAPKQPRFYIWVRYLENVFTEALPSNVLFQLVVWKHVLTIRYLAMDYWVTISWNNTLQFTVSIVRRYTSIFLEETHILFKWIVSCWSYRSFPVNLHFDVQKRTYYALK